MVVPIGWLGEGLRKATALTKPDAVELMWSSNDCVSGLHDHRRTVLSRETDTIEFGPAKVTSRTWGQLAGGGGLYGSSFGGMRTSSSWAARDADSL